MKKLILFLALIVAVVHAESSLYLDAGGKGIGIGDKFKFYVCFIHFGGHIFPYYEYNEPIGSPNWHLLGIELYPYLGLGMDFKLNNNYEISPYLDFIHQFYFAYEQHNNEKGIVVDVTNPYLIRTGIEIIVNKLKLPIGFSTDFYLLILGKTYPGIEILPRITIYLK